MIDRWNILHLNKRVERETLSLSNAERLGVPREIINFWEARDADAFKDAQDITDAIVADGFPEFAEGVGNTEKLGRNCQLWNVCRFLRDLANRNAIEMLIHDGMAITYTGSNYEFYPDFQWFCDAAAECVAVAKSRGTTFKLLTVGHVEMMQPVELIHPTSMISHGILSNSNSIRIYSSDGAACVLERILQNTDYYRKASADHVFFSQNDGEFLWNLPGAFSLIMPVGLDMPSELLGSDSVDWPRYQGIYKEIFNHGSS